jgi:hypothetical protein
MTVMVSRYHWLIIGLVGQNLHAAVKRQAVIFLQNLAEELVWNSLLLTKAGSGPGSLCSEINLPADQCTA